MNALIYLFIYTCCLALFLPLFFPFLHLLFFAPFLTFCFYRCSLSICLWWALSCGLIIDLFSSETRLGMYAVNYCLTTLCLYRYKFHFFEDRLSTLPTISFGFTFLSTLIQLGLFSLSGKLFSISWEWIFHDLFLIPFQVAFYAIIAFILPSFLFSYLKRRYFLMRFTHTRSKTFRRK